MKKKIILVICAFCLILLGAATLKFFTGYEIYRNVKYGTTEANVMDVYIPQRAFGRKSNGCVLFIHGGSWSGGDKSEEALKCRLLASHGYLAATVNYTLWSEETSDEYTVFGVLDELDAALETLKAFVNEQGIALDKAAVAGYSAGAHLAMLYAYARADSAPLPIVFTASMAGPADIFPDVWGNDMTMRIAKLLTGQDVTEEMLQTGEADALLSSISPISYITEASPPTIILHGGKDTVVPIANTTSLIARLSEHAVRHEYIYMKNADHALIQNPFRRLAYLKALLTYCDEYIC